MPSSLPEIRESEAPPEIAAIYDEFKQATGLPVVNLIYRHLATLPGVLPWVWSLVRGPVVAGQAEQAAIRLGAALRAQQLDPSVAHEARLHALDADGIRAVLDVYHQGNILNLVCLTAVLAVFNAPQPTPPSGVGLTAAGAAQTLARQRTGAQEAIPLLPKYASLPPDVAALVQSLAQLHDKASTAGVTPSLYLHLAHWPEFLRAVRAPLASRFADASIERDRSNLQRLAENETAPLAAVMTADQPRPQGESLQAVRQALEMFTQRVIPEMIVVGLVLRGALPERDAAL